MDGDCSSLKALELPTDSAMESAWNELSTEPTGASGECETDADGDRLGGFVWKFPSEGSNTRPGDASSEASETHVYPRKCRYCQRAWVSSFVNERRHGTSCRAQQNASDRTAAPASLGIARRVWCEVDAALTGIQWRDDVAAEQDSVASYIAFQEMVEVVALREPSESFQITTRSGRRVVFQCRVKSDGYGHQQGQENGTYSTVATRALDARQWVEYLQMFSRFTQDQAIATIHEEDAPGERLNLSTVGTNKALNDELLLELRRVIGASDVDALEEILNDAEFGATARSLTDSSGSSLLVQAIKMEADSRVIRTMIKAGVDCNAKNNDNESPLLIAAASGDLELVRILLRAGGIRVNQRCAMGATAFHAAANAGEVDVLRALCDHGEVAIKYVDENGWTALHYAAACASGREAMSFLCELMIELVDAQCIQGNTPLHVAAGCGCEENVRVLLHTAANPHVQNSDGHTPYHVALHNHHIACAMAVHEYMETPRDVYERVPCVEFNSANAKEDRVAPAETTSVMYPHRHAVDRDYDSFASSAWTEYYTEDQIPYYYNAMTGESTWHPPEPWKLAPPPAPTLYPLDVGSVSIVDDEAEPHHSTDEPGQKLPLCMIPLVSPLVSLDDPTAATKFDSRRKKDRERRRAKLLKQRSSHLSHHDIPPPPPPVHHHQRRSVSSTRVHRVDVQ